MNILVSGYVIRKPMAGLAWHYGQYLLGLKRLGHNVVYVEDSENIAGDVSSNLVYAESVFTYFGLRDAWAFFDFSDSRWKGPAAGRLEQILSSSDVLINVSGSLAVTDWFAKVPVRVFVDTDPVFTQAKNLNYPAWAARCNAHTHFVSFGENASMPGCTVPVDGFHWRPTRQPIVLEMWTNPRPPDRGFTTIMSWRSYESVTAEGVRFGIKADTFDIIRTLPLRSDAAFEIALDGSDEVKSELRASGWQVGSGQAISSHPGRYRDYIQRSMGECTVAKEAYVKSRSGWFSERSACYLASGRPVIVQDTAFSTWLDEGLGVLSFQSEEEALSAVEAVLTDYRKHTTAAREQAELFCSDRVLTQLLDDVTTTPASRAAPVATAERNLSRYRALTNAIAHTIPDGEPFVLIDDQEIGLFGYLGDRRVYPFLESNGRYWGRPRDSSEAVSELQRLIALGAQHVVVSAECFWWIDFYEGFAHYLVGYFDLASEDSQARIYRLSHGRHI